jgi:hypothetical protein
MESELIGVRFKMSALGLERSPSFAGKEGVIIGRGRYHRSVRVQFDSNKSSTTLHRDYIELIPPGAELAGFSQSCAGADRPTQATHGSRIHQRPS